MTIRLHPRITAFLAVILTMVWLSETSAAGEKPLANLAADGRSFIISAADFADFRAT
jgi:hypothetical protein